MRPAPGGPVNKAMGIEKKYIVVPKVRTQLVDNPELRKANVR